MAERAVLKRGSSKPAKRRTPARRKAAKPRRGANPFVLPGVLILLAVGALGAAWLYQLPTKLWYAAANIVGSAGFEVRDVDVRGAEHLQKLPVYTAALDGASNSMLLVDLDTVRSRLEALPWIRSASVGRVLPDRLVIDIEEREPAAIWQNEERHRLIDREGHVLQTSGLEAYSGLPLIVDDGADREAGRLLDLLEDYPAVREMLLAATWRSGRRWDFDLKTGERLMLPEGDADIRWALTTFTRLERTPGLTGRGFATIDFRVPEQMVVRVSKEPGAGFETLEATEI
ncbi:hypothetical protein B5C34_10500 [Pacificimonas flava]|uniref:Cell division protein FtsQ n=2 Tax=Pacificimonas TaxID=1960290 RepID=A0A219B685_9SPHN|nr:MULTISPECIES: FtsQ-type POTRA domain-containing protein [Pacificimonas]MBZ6378901.1 FtsQ-type POTRA domain-containing protein [Pacificimonas aurantium]OWV33847.1 hypothetical protein B5C34_10500 [Pacificimonas flava]